MGTILKVLRLIINLFAKNTDKNKPIRKIPNPEFSIQVNPLVIPNNSIGWKAIMLHHSKTKDDKTVSWDAIRKYHMEINGWSDIGYHFGIEEINGKLKLMVGRSLYKQGAHCKDAGMNAISIGICLIGDWDKVRPDKERIEFLKTLVLFLREKFNIRRELVLSHNEFNKLKSCPGKSIRHDEWRELLS